MKKLLLSFSLFLFLLGSCQQPNESEKEASEENEFKSIVAAPCDFKESDSVSTQKRLRGEWELAGIKTNTMGAKPTEFLTGEQIRTPRTLTFFPNNEFEITINGRKEGSRQKFVVDGQSLTPLAYQFWFCGESTLILSNIAADGPTEVYIKK